MINSLNVPTRPVFSREEAVAIGRRILELSTADEVRVRIEHDAIGTTRINRLKKVASQDRETIRLRLHLQFGSTTTGSAIEINQLDDETLRVVVPYLEQLAKEQIRPTSDPMKGMYDGPNRPLLPVQLWHDATIEALEEVRSQAIPAMLAEAHRAGLTAAIFVGATARAMCVVTSRGQESYNQQTDAEVNATCWTADGRASGWGGVASRNWSALDPMAAMRDAVVIARQSVNQQALEPGRRTAILGRAATAQLVRNMGYAFDGTQTIIFARTPFSLPTQSSPIGTPVFDTRVTMVSDPADPEGGYTPFFLSPFGIREGDGLPQGAFRWVEQGILKKLYYDPLGGATLGVGDISETPTSLRLEAEGETATTEEMIANCPSGVYVNRFSGVSLTDPKSGMMTGVTNGGCFLIKDGKIDRPLRNFRFVDSPFFSLNSLIMIGRTRRTALGFVGSRNFQWPLNPVIVPPLMVRDFNFAALADVV